MLVPGAAHVPLVLTWARTAECALAPMPGSVLHVLNMFAPVEDALATRLEGFMFLCLWDIPGTCGCAPRSARA